MTDERRITLFSFGNSLLASFMAICLAATFARLINLVASSWVLDLFALQNGWIVGVFLVALEVQWTRRLIEPRPALSARWWKGVGIEWGLLILGLLAMIWLTEGPEFALRDLQAFSTWNLLEAIRVEHVEGLLLLLTVWGFSRYLVADLLPLENLSIPRSSEQIREIEQIQSQARNRVWNDVFFFGGFIVLLSVFGVTVVRIARNLPLGFGPLGPEILVYFLCGLGLFAISRMLVLRMDWVSDRTRFDPGISRRWLAYSFGFILILVFLASALPTKYSLDLLTSLNLAVMGVGRVLMVLWALIVLPFTLMVSFIVSFLRIGTVNTVPTAERPPLDDIPALPAGITWVTVLREILFWVLVVLALVYLLRQFLKFRLTILRRLRRWRILRWLSDWLRGVRMRVTVWSRKLARTMQDSLHTLRDDLTRRTGWEPRGFINLRRLTPRQSIRFYFFALLRRGAERGAARRPAQSPREYSTGLMYRDESVKDELGEMTLAFEEARYTAHDIGPEKAHRVRKVWDTIRSKMRIPQGKAESDGNRTP
jgi:Na+-transporting methylmalonyl-CoA/oxaloacetate decarboxylase gamma subunit